MGNPGELPSVSADLFDLSSAIAGWKKVRRTLALLALAFADISYGYAVDTFKPG
jgi:hypothetical protein